MWGTESSQQYFEVECESFLPHAQSLNDYCRENWAWPLVRNCGAYEECKLLDAESD